MSIDMQGILFGGDEKMNAKGTYFLLVSNLMI